MATFFFILGVYFVQVPKLGFKVGMSSFCNGKAGPGTWFSPVILRVLPVIEGYTSLSLSGVVLLLRMGEALRDKQEALVQPL